MPPGPGVDLFGRVVADPSDNVNRAVEAEVRRIDDLREADNKFNDAALDHIEKEASLRAEYDDKLRDAESKRIDAIRAVDVAAVASSARDSAMIASTLATQVATSAETLRTQVATTQVAAQTALVAALEPIQKDIADLRRIQYEQQGQKTGNPDAAALLDAIAPLTKAITDLQLAQATGKGHDSGEDKSAGAVAALGAAKTAKNAVIIAAVSGVGYFIYLVISVATKGKF